MSKSAKRLHAPTFKGVVSNKGPGKVGLDRAEAHVEHQCEPTEAMPTRMQYNWAAYTGEVAQVKKDW